MVMALIFPFFTLFNNHVTSEGTLYFADIAMAVRQSLLAGCHLNFIFVKFCQRTKISNQHCSETLQFNLDISGQDNIKFLPLLFLCAFFYFVLFFDSLNYAWLALKFFRY